jgi:hypothetical protein
VTFITYAVRSDRFTDTIPNINSRVFQIVSIYQRIELVTQGFELLELKMQLYMKRTQKCIAQIGLALSYLTKEDNNLTHGGSSYPGNPFELKYDLCCCRLCRAL